MTGLSSALRRVGSGLNRPECVLATRDGSLFVSERGRGVCWIAPDGMQRVAGPVDAAFVPNGIAFRSDGRLVIANIGDAGGLWLLEDDGGLRSLVPELEGMPVNFVTTGPDGRLWVSVSTRRAPRHLAYRSDVADGFVATVEPTFSIIADGLAYANELRVTDDGWLYVSETMGFRVTRRPLLHDVAGAAQIAAELPAGWFADGIAFDVEGGLWLACIVANALLRFTPDGNSSIVVADTNDSWVAQVATAFADGTMGRLHFDTSPGTLMRNVTSIAFGGPNLTTVYLGSLADNAILAFEASVAGLPPPHWNVAPVLAAFNQSEG
jgi:sugar lactone lactonase YvrE